MIPDKTKFSDAEPGDGANHCFAEECSTPSAVVRPLQADDPGRLLSYSWVVKGSQSDFICVISGITVMAESP